MTSTTPIHAPYRGATSEDAHRELASILQQHIDAHPRSLQQAIGPSEIGIECEHCLAAKLAHLASVDGSRWLPTIGTAMHAYCEEGVVKHEIERNAVHTGGVEFLCERRVMVGHLDGKEVWGSTDVFHTPSGTVIDYKFVGKRRLADYQKLGPSTQYRVQAHLYGRGWVAAGYEVSSVAIWFLPRDDWRGMSAGYWWTEPYDEQVAIDALARAGRIINGINMVGNMGGDVAAYVDTLPRAPGCYQCRRYDAAIPPTLDNVFALNERNHQ